MSKIATEKYISDLTGSGTSSNRCPSKSLIVNNYPSVEIAGSYSNTQLVKEDDIHKPSPKGTLEMPFNSGSIQGSNLILPYTDHDTPYSFSVPTSIASIVDSSLVLVTSSTESIEIPGMIPLLNNIFKTGVFSISYYVNSTGGANTAVDILSTYPYRITSSSIVTNGIGTAIGRYGHEVRFSFGTTMVLNSSGYAVINIGNKNWVKITCIIDGTNLSVYEGDVLKDTRSITRFTGCSGSNFYLANLDPYSGNTIRLKKLKIFDRALSTDEIALL